jgi:hypothetical protein
MEEYNSPMRVPYSIQGFLFAPAVVSLIFILKITCPAATGYGCFADNFLPIVFIPLTFLYKIFGQVAPTLAQHEPLFVLGYWALIGLFSGLVVDLWKAKERDSS